MFDVHQVGYYSSSRWYDDGDDKVSEIREEDLRRFYCVWRIGVDRYSFHCKLELQRQCPSQIQRKGVNGVIIGEM